MSVSPKRHIKISLDEFEKQPFLFFTHDDKNRESSNNDDNLGLLSVRKDIASQLHKV